MSPPLYQLAIITVCASASMACATVPSAALERSGTTKVTVDGQHDAFSTFVLSFDPETGVFNRKGTVTLPNKRRISYEIEGKCSAARDCTFRGTGKGPYGGTWTGEGQVTGVGGKNSLLILNLTSPIGTKMVVEHSVSGDSFPF
jgi:hypothetical protein